MIHIDGDNLTLEQVNSVSRNYEKVQLTDHALARIHESRGWVEEIIASEKPVSGG